MVQAKGEISVARIRSTVKLLLFTSLNIINICTSNLTSTSCHFYSFDYHNYSTYQLFLKETDYKDQVGVYFQTLPDSSSSFPWEVNRTGCIWVSFRVLERPSEIDVSLFSIQTLVYTKYEECYNVSAISTRNSLNLPNKDSKKSINGTMIWFCGFSFKVVDEGLYNISVRSKFCQAPSEDSIDWPESQLGYYYGRWTHAWTLHRLYQIYVGSPANKITSLANQLQGHHKLPLCTFHHEKLLYEGHGNPRWVKVSDSHRDHNTELLRKIWFEDSYEWVNGLCRNIPLTKEQFLVGMEQQNIRKILFLGDSISRFMAFDFKEFLGGITQDWLNKNPIHYNDEDRNISNWDHIMVDWMMHQNGTHRSYYIKAGYCNNLFDEEVNGGYIPSCCQTNTCSNFSIEIKLLQFYSGEDFHYYRDWTRLVMVLNNLMGKEFYPDVLVFNAGHWIQIFPCPFHHRIQQMRNIAKAMAEICKKRRITLIWRSSLYQHGKTISQEVITMNKEAIRIISEYPNTYIFDTPFAMTALRPDTASDGFHYSYRKPHGIWHLCDLPAESFRMNCLRAPDFPLSSGRGMALMLANMLIHSGNIRYA